MDIPKYKIMIVEDDTLIAQAIAKHVAAWGCEAYCCQDFGQVLKEFLDFGPHLVIMDIGLPLYNGYHWCSRIRSVSQAPILFLSSAAEDMNIVMAMNMGGDDFVAKPFTMEVLAAKVMALLRRAYDFTMIDQVLECGGAILNVGDGSLTYEGQRLDLTRNEYRILYTLMKSKGRIVSREALMEALWENDAYVDENTLTVNMTRLRRSLEAIGLVGLIATKKGAGYLVE